MKKKKNVEKKEVIIGYEKTNNSTFRVIADAETGEIIDESWITVNKGKPGIRKNTGAHFVKLYKTNLIQLASEIIKDEKTGSRKKRLDLNEAGLFFMLISISGWQTPYIMHPETNKLMSCSAIADFLGLSRKNTFNLIERLISKGMISKVYNGNGRANHYMINPNIAFWGKTIDDTGHMDVFKDCPYEPEVYIKYRKTPENKK